MEFGFGHLPDEAGVQGLSAGEDVAVRDHNTVADPSARADADLVVVVAMTSGPRRTAYGPTTTRRPSRTPGPTTALE